MICPKRLLLILIFSSFFLASSVSAATNVSTPSSQSTTGTKEATMPAQSQVVTPTLPVNLQAVVAANVLYNRLTAASSRLTLVFERITSRMQKMNFLPVAARASSKVKQLNTQYNLLKSQIDKLSAEKTKASTLYQTFSTNPESVNYQTLRKEIVTIDSLMKQILEGEKGLVRAVKQVAPTASISAIPTVTKAVTATPKAK